MTSSAPSRLPLLLVDDDPLITDSLAYVLGKDFSISIASNREQAVAYLRAGARPAIALVDLGLPPVPHQPDEGFALVTDIVVHSPQTRIIVLSGQSDEKNAKHARALGATEFASKPAHPDQIRDLIRKVLSFNESSPPPIDDGILGNSPAIQKLKEHIRQVANAPFPVLIEGESGSGKELVAAALQRFSARSDAPFLTLNCAAISPSLVEATLFGHAKGAFTGAVNARPGYFEEAGNGTLFLDEIGELPLELQPKLLRVLEKGDFQRIGETNTRHSAARVIAATNRDLRKEIKDGRFRSDLYHRLSVFTVTVPPLRQRASDSLLLIGQFLEEYARQSNSPAARLGPSAIQRLENYGFPGNVRELKNIAIRLTTRYAGQQVDLSQIEAELDVESVLTSGSQGSATSLILGPLNHPAQDAISAAIAELQSNEGFNLDSRLREIESNYIEAAQQLSHGNLSQTSRLLGINRTTLYNRLETLGREREKSH
jgi:two-component system nitrogen regulation response regulator GlnG